MTMIAPHATIMEKILEILLILLNLLKKIQNVPVLPKNLVIFATQLGLLHGFLGRLQHITLQEV